MHRAIVAWLCMLSAVALAQQPPVNPATPDTATTGQAAPGTEQATPPAPASPSVEQVSATQVPGTAPSDDWSMHSGKTMGENQSAIGGEVGWPGLQTEYMFGIKPFLDLGARFEFDWSFLGDTKTTAPGIKLQGIIRVHLLDMGKVVMSFRFEPGFLTFFFSSNGVNALSPGPSPSTDFRSAPRGPLATLRSPRQITEPPPGSSSSGSSYDGTLFGITTPVGLEFGMPVQQNFLLNAKVSVPLTFTFGNVNGGTIVPVMIGVGMEFRIQPRLSLIGDIAAGPIFYVNSGTEFGLQAQVGVAYRL
jgi:hypothetical protein